MFSSEEYVVIKDLPLGTCFQLLSQSKGLTTEELYLRYKCDFMMNAHPSGFEDIHGYGMPIRASLITIQY
jgi:hypothetical protein